MTLHWEDRYGHLTLGDEGEAAALLDAYQRERTLRRGLPNPASKGLVRLRPACAAARRRASVFELSTAHRDPGHHANAACIHGQGLQGCRRCSSIGACDLRSSSRRAAAARSAPSPATCVARAPGRWLGARRRDERVPRSARAPASRPEPRANLECGSRRALPRESSPRHRGATARTPVAEPQIGHGTPRVTSSTGAARAGSGVLARTGRARRRWEAGSRSMDRTPRHSATG